MAGIGSARLGLLFAALALAVAFGTPPTSAGVGQTTPGAVVTAENPRGLGLTLTAHSEKSTVPDASCRPRDASIRCWGSLVLRTPGGLTIIGIEVHRVAVGDAPCSGGEDGGDDCGGHAAVTALPQSDPVHAAVRGVATLDDPGDTGMPAGSTVQVFIDLTDSGTRDGDRAEVRVRPFVDGSDTPAWAYDSGLQPVRQVQIRVLGPAG